MKKFLLPLILLNLIFTPCVFGASNTDILNKIENSLFGFEYNNENDSTRVERIEEQVYGINKSGAINQRIANLNKDLGAELYGQEIEPCEDTLLKEEEEREVLSSQDPNIDYPVINELEKSVFKKEFKNLGVKDRLSQLEKNIFTKDYVNDDLSTRVDRLREKIQPQGLNSDIANAVDNFYTGGYYPPPIDYDSMTIGGNSSSFNSQFDSYNSMPNSIIPSRKINLSTVENALYNKNFKNDNMNNRLERVEQSIFGESFADEDEQTRIGRISSAFNAQKSAQKYDANKFAQGMSTAMQIGTMLLMILACIL